MILVDSSVWINHLNDAATDAVLCLRRLLTERPLLVGDLILCEVLQGLRSERAARRVEQALRRFETVALLDADLAVKAAANYRLLRGRGITIRKTIDLIIGTFCIEHGHALLHDDRDFDPMVHFLGLQAV